MPIKYIPYVPDTVEGQAVLDNITRTRRVLRYRDNGVVIERLRRGLPLYDVVATETVGYAAGGVNTVGADNLVLRGECLSACAYLKDNGVSVDLVYIDPPFASGADYAKSVYLRRNPGKAEQLADAETELELDELRAFEEKMYGDIWNKEDYLNWMFENLHAIKNVMSETASIYVHLDWHIGHYVKVLMDEVFGEENFRNEIVVKRIKKNIREREYVKSLNVATDSIFYYVKNDDVMILPPTKPDVKGERWHSFEAQGFRGGMDYDLFGHKPGSGKHWRWKEDKAREAVRNYVAWKTTFEAEISLTEYWIETEKSKAFLRAHETSGLPEYFIPASSESLCDSLWDDISAYAFSHDYSTEKSEPLLQRILKASSDEGMVVADFFGGSGVTAKVAHDLGRRFVHVDVGVNSVQTARDRLKAAGASFTVHDIQDGVSLFRNPVQTMDKLKTLITGLKNEDGLDKFWEGAITDSKRGVMPVYLPNLLDHQAKTLDVFLINRVLNEALPDLPDDTHTAIVYYVDIADRAGVEKHIRDHNPTATKIELRDLKEVLDEVVLGDEAEFTVGKPSGTPGFVVEITRFASDRLLQKINEYNQKRVLTGKASATALSLAASDSDDTDAPTPSKASFKPIHISENGLDLIEWVSVDCTSASGPWRSDREVKIDKKGFMVRDGVKTKAFWDATITSAQKPLRLKIRNIAGDESVFAVPCSPQTIPPLSQTQS